MKVAVLMSTYNGEKYLRQQIESILNQQGDFTLELWVRDDGSKDTTVQLLQTYEKEGKLQWYSGDNLKPAHSFWDLLLHCPGYTYYAFADQDDVWELDKLQRGISALKDISGPAFCFGNAQLVDHQLQSLGRNVYRSCPALDLPTLSCAGDVLGCTMILNAALAQLIQSRSVPEKMVMHDFYAALVCLVAGGTVVYDDAPLLQYRQHGNNVVGVSRSKWAALKARFSAILKARPVTVSQQAECLLEQYTDVAKSEHRIWLRKLANRSLPGRIRVACSGKTRYVSINKSITLRLALLLGNR